MNAPIIELVRERTAQLRGKGYKTTQAKVKEGLAQAYGYRCYDALFYDRDGRIPTSEFIEPIFWRVIGYKDGSLS